VARDVVKVLNYNGSLERLMLDYNGAGSATVFKIKNS
jgi:hypothetical protein